MLSVVSEDNLSPVYSDFNCLVTDSLVSSLGTLIIISRFIIIWQVSLKRREWDQNGMKWRRKEDDDDKGEKMSCESQTFFLLSDECCVYAVFVTQG